MRASLVPTMILSGFFVIGLSTTSDSIIIFYGDPNSGNGWDTTSVVSLHTAVAGGFSSEHSPARAAIQTIDGSSILSGPGDETDLHNNATAAVGMWLGIAAGTNPRGGTVAGSNWIAYDLGAVRPVDALAIWNYSESGFSVFGMKDVTIEYSTTGSTNSGDWTTFFDGQIPQASASAPSAAEIVIENTVSSRYFVITSDTGPDGNWDPPGGSDFTGQDGLSEVRFGVIPEPQLEQACCFDDGSCQDLDPNDCTNQGGTPQGEGTTCATASCPQPQACCMPDGTCQDLLTNLCVAASGVPQGVFSTCGGTSCPQPEACCFDAAPWCTDLTPDDCTAAGGTSGGLGTACATFDCTGSMETVATNAVVVGLDTFDGFRYDLEQATSLNPDWADEDNSWLVGSGTNETLVGDEGTDPNTSYRWNGFMPPDPCGIAAAIGNPSASNGWDTTSAVSSRSSKEKAGRPFVNVINGSGISADGCTHTDLLAGGGSGGTTMGFNEGPTSGPARGGTVAGANWVEFGFDQSYNIFDILLWNYNEDVTTPGGPDVSDSWSRQGMKEVTIQYTTVGGGGPGGAWGSDTPGDWTTLGGTNVILTKGTGGNFLEAQTIPLDAAAQYVVITAVNGTNANFMCDTLGGAFCTTNVSVEGALSEVRFTLGEPGAAPPPLDPPAIDSAYLADVTGLSFLSSPGVVYELEKAVKVIPSLGSPFASNGWDTTSIVSIHTAVAGGFSSEHSAARAAIQTIDGSSILSGPGDETDLHNNSTGAAGMWLGIAAGTNPRGGTVAGSNWVAYDLGAVREIAAMHIWNYGEANFSEFGMNQVTIEYSTTGSTDTNDWSVYYDGQIPRASHTAPSGAELLIENTVTAQYFVITSDNGSDGNYDGPTDPFIGQEGLSEVRFLEAGAGPPDISTAIFESTRAFTVGDGGTQTLYDPDGWDPVNFWYRVVPQ